MEQNILDISLDKYAASIQKLQGNLNNLDSQSKEYVKTLTELQTLQNQFNEALETANDSVQSTAGNIETYSSHVDNLNKTFETSSGTIKGFNTVMQGVGNLSQALGINIGGVTKAIGIYNTTTQAATVLTETFGITAKAAWISTGIGAIILAIVSALKFFFDATKKDEQATNDMKVALTAIQPVLDLIKNAINVVARAVAGAARTFAEGLPKALKIAGQALAAVPRWIGNVVQAFGNMNKFIGNIMDGFYQIIGKALAAAAGKFAEFADWLGLDGIAKKINGLADNLKNLKSPFTYVGQAAESVAKTFDGYADKITKTFDGMASKQETYLAMAKEDISLQQDKLKLEKENEESLARQIDLRRQIAKEDDPKKKLELQKQLGDEITKNGEAQVEYARRVYEQEKKRQSLSPSSIADKEYLASLERNVLAAENTYNQMLIKVDKQTAATHEKMSASAVKAAEKALKEAEKLSRELMSKATTEITGVKTQGKGEADQKKAEIEILRALNKSKADVEQEYANDIYAIKKKALDDEMAILQASIDNNDIMENEKLKLINQLTAAQNEARNLANEKQLEDIKILHQKQKEETEEFEKSQVDIQREMIEQWSEQLSELQPSMQEKILNTYVPEELREQLKERLQAMHEDQFQVMREDEERLNAQTMDYLKLLEVQLEERAKKGEDVANEQKELDQRLEQEANRHAMAMAKIDQKETKSKQDNFKKQAKAAQQLAKQLGSIFSQIAQLEQDQIKQRYERGEISEEQAKEEFERTKKIQIAGAIMETLSGALASQMSVWTEKSLPLWGKIAMSVLLGISTLTSGMMQVKQIQATQFDSGGSGGASSAASQAASNAAATIIPANIAPLVDENRDMDNLQTVDVGSSSQDNRVYIVEQDIQDSNERVEVRENNTTF